MNIGIILAGGIGSRFGQKIPKQYQKINGREVIYYAIHALEAAKHIDKIIICVQNEYIKGLSERYGNAIVIQGGSSRNKSLKNALNYIKQNLICEKIIVLEAARPMITSDLVDMYLEKLDENDAVITGQKIVSSLGSKLQHIVNRDDYYLIQAPEAFKFNLLYDNFDENSFITATNQQLPEGAKLYINFDFTNNQKITYFQDLKYCENLMEEK